MRGGEMQDDPVEEQLENLVKSNGKSLFVVLCVCACAGLAMLIVGVVFATTHSEHHDQVTEINEAVREWMGTAEDGDEGTRALFNKKSFKFTDKTAPFDLTTVEDDVFEEDTSELEIWKPLQSLDYYAFDSTYDEPTGDPTSGSPPQRNKLQLTTQVTEVGGTEKFSLPEVPFIRGHVDSNYATQAACETALGIWSSDRCTVWYRLTHVCLLVDVEEGHVKEQHGHSGCYPFPDNAKADQASWGRYSDVVDLRASTTDNKAAHRHFTGVWVEVRSTDDPYVVMVDVTHGSTKLDSNADTVNTGTTMLIVGSTMTACVLIIAIALFASAKRRAMAAAALKGQDGEEEMKPMSSAADNAL